ncbi:MAG: peroxiredoxin [bacterium]
MNDLQKAPSFSCQNQDDQTVSLEDFKGKWLVLYFYPKDSTSGCTKQAIAFSEQKSAFDALNVQLLGISKDSIRSHQRFIEKFDLRIPLLSDPDTQIHQDYDVWKEKSMYGKKYFGAERSTFVITPEGLIHKKWSKVKVPGHVDEVLAYLRSVIR